MKKAGTISAAAAFGLNSQIAACDSNDPVRIGIVGVGERGKYLVKILLDIEGVEIPDICDINYSQYCRQSLL